MVSRFRALAARERRPSVIWLLCAALVLLHAGRAAAAPGGAEQTAADEVPPLARQRYQEGTAAYQQGRYTEAMDLFKEADKLAPSAALSFNIARAAEKIGDAPAALAAYRDYLRRAPDATDRAQVERLVRRLAKQLQKKGVQQVTVLSEPSGATVVVDEQPVGVTPWTGELPPGTHRLVLRSPGRTDAAQSFELAPDQPRDVRAELAPAPPGESERAHLASLPDSWSGSGAEPGTAESGERRSSARVGALTWVTLGAGAAVMVGAGVFELGRQSALDSAREEKTQIGRGEQLETVESRMNTARVLAAVGGGLLVLGGILVVIDLAPGTQAPKTAVGMSCGAAGCGVLGSTRF